MTTIRLRVGTRFTCDDCGRCTTLLASAPTEMPIGWRVRARDSADGMRLEHVCGGCRARAQAPSS